LSFPPSFIVRKRPMLPSEWYAATFFPEEYAAGQGYGFSVIAESILNFYYAGPLLYGFLLGLLFLYLDMQVKKTSSFYFFVLYCILLYYIFLIPRSGIAGLIKPATSVILFSILCIFVVSKVLNARKQQLQ
jgi:oligosaccharide repeat unit polymerase